MTLLFTLMLLLLRVLVLLLIPVLIGQTKQTARSGMLMVVVLGSLVIRVLFIMGIHEVVMVLHDVLGMKQVVLELVTNQAVRRKTIVMEVLVLGVVLPLHHVVVL